jgi:trehalose 6-phosphate phosphatase
LEHLLSDWPRIIDQIRKARHVIFLSDFDGTLTPIMERPEMVILEQTTRNLLHALISQAHFTVGIISGRSISDLKERVDVEGVIYAGNHGFEIEGPGISFINPVVSKITPLFRVIRQILTLSFGAFKGVFIEDKGITLSVHYRQVDDEKAALVKSLVERAATSPASQGLFKVTAGKKVYEVRPAVDWDKGKAVRLLMKKYGRGGRNSGLLPIYLGDDVTDESAFEMVEKYGWGISVHVGEPKNNSAAHYFLSSPEEVHNFISKLLDSSQNEYLSEEYSPTT